MSYPLFGGLPGGPELLIVLLLLTFGLIIPIGLSVWVYTDARGRTDHGLAWAVATFVASFTPLYVGGLAVAVLYAVVRDELGDSADTSSFEEEDFHEDAEVLGQPIGQQVGDTANADETADGADQVTGDGNPSFGGGPAGAGSEGEQQPQTVDTDPQPDEASGEPAAGVPEDESGQGADSDPNEGGASTDDGDDDRATDGDDDQITDEASGNDTPVDGEDGESNSDGGAREN